jgi:alkanesulfonate monooxygenase SsuD/methylene tetrahydromethanopterin reductase-like flavin-dependent oxidoreductase (luciferase family)
VGEWADGLITINQSPEHLKRMIDAFRAGGGEGKPIYLQVHLSYARDEQIALDIAHEQWRSNVFAPPVCWDLESPAHFDEASRFVRKDDMRDSVLISSDPAMFVDWLSELAGLGFDGLYLHHVGVEQQEFIETFGERVLPMLVRS